MIDRRLFLFAANSFTSILQNRDIKFTACIKVVLFGTHCPHTQGSIFAALGVTTHDGAHPHLGDKLDLVVLTK